MGVGNRSPLTRPHGHKSKLIRRRVNVCFHAHYGLIADIAPCPFCANFRHCGFEPLKINRPQSAAAKRKDARTRPLVVVCLTMLSEPQVGLALAAITARAVKDQWRTTFSQEQVSTRDSLE